MEDKKEIKWRDELINLFPDVTTRILKENSKWCDKCNGVGLVKNGYFIETCDKCHGKGYIELCDNGDGNNRFNHYTICRDCKEKEWKETLLTKEQERFEKAKKIKFSEYDGKFFSDSDIIIDADDFTEELYLKYCDGEDIKNYVYATISYNNIDIDIYEIVCNCCEDDGYEDQYSFLDTKGLQEIQNKIDEWIEQQGECALIYQEDYATVILLDELIETFKEEMENE